MSLVIENVEWVLDCYFSSPSQKKFIKTKYKNRNPTCDKYMYISNMLNILRDQVNDMQCVAYM